MKSTLVIGWIVGLAAGVGVAFAADPPNLLDVLIKQLQGEGTLEAKSPEELEAAYAKALDKLTPDKPESNDIELQKIVFRASRPGAEVERAALGRVMAQRLEKASPPVQVVLLRHIQRFGREEVVPPVTELLASPDERVRECARRALEANPSMLASDVLKGQIEKATDPKWKVALLTALEYRRDAGDAPVFAKYAASEDEMVRVPAMLALARTGDASHAKVLGEARKQGTEAAEAAATDAFLLLADRLASSQGTIEEAAKMYKELLASPQPYKYAAIAGLGNLGAGEENIKALVGLLGDKDPEARGAALEALARHKNEKVAAAIVERLGAKDAEAAAKPALLRALLEQGDRKHAKVFVDAVSSEDVGVRVQALRALAILGDASTLPSMIKSAQAKGEEQQAARKALDEVPGKDVDNALMQMAQQGEPPARVEAIRALGTRLVEPAVPILLKSAADNEGSVRSESMRALAAVGEQGVLPQVVELVTKAKDDGEREQAQRTVVAIARKSQDVDGRIAPILAATEKAEPQTKAVLIAALGQLGGGKALAAVKEAIKSQDEKIHEAGVRALSSWPDGGPRVDVLELAKTEKKENLQILAVRGYIRMIGMDRDKRSTDEQLKLYQNALDLSKRPDEKKMVLSGLREVKHVKTLEMIKPLIDQEEVSAEASDAALRIARDIWEKEVNEAEIVKTAITKAGEKTKNEAAKKGAKEVLDKILEKQQQKKPA